MDIWTIAYAVILIDFARMCNCWVRVLAPSPKIAVLGKDPVTLECSYTADDSKDIVLGAYWYRKNIHDKKFSLIAQIPNKDFVNLPPTFTDLILKQKAKLDSHKNGSFVVTTLTISNVDCLDEGIYQCEIQVYGGRQPSKARVELIINEEPSTPSLKQHPEVTVENQRVTFTCTGVLGKPRGHVKWLIFRHADNALKPVEMAGMTSVQPSSISCSPIGESTLEVLATKDDVRIKCIVEQYGNRGEAPVRREDERKLDVYYSVRNTQISVYVNSRLRQTSDVLVTEGDKVNLTCGSSGNPEPVYTWRHMPLSPEQGETVSTAAPILEIKQWKFNLGNISANQSGIYTCTAENSIHTKIYSEAKSVKINVQERLLPNGFTNYGGDTGSGGFQETSGHIALYIMIGGIVVGACIFVVVTSLLAVQCFRRHRKPSSVRYQGRPNGVKT